MACNLNDELNARVRELFYSDFNDENIRNVLDYIEDYLQYNLERSAKDIIEYIKEEDKPLSSYEIKNHSYFKNFHIKMEEVLKVLCNNNILIKSEKEFRDLKGSLLAVENVYSYKK